MEVIPVVVVYFVFYERKWWGTVYRPGPLEGAQVAAIENERDTKPENEMGNQ